jgi:hypothetical protein
MISGTRLWPARVCQGARKSFELSPRVSPRTLARERKFDADKIEEQLAVLFREQLDSAKVAIPAISATIFGTKAPPDATAVSDVYTLATSSNETFDPSTRLVGISGSLLQQRHSTYVAPLPRSCQPYARHGGCLACTVAMGNL